jgi:hypothetical protein
MTKIRKEQIVDLSLSEFNDDIGATEFEIIKVIDKAQIINQKLDATKKYSIRQSLVLGDGEFINMDESALIEGLGADFTNITTTSATGIIFKSQVAQNINIKNISLSAVAVGSKVFDLKDEDANISTSTKGSYEFRLVGVNFTGCKDLGIINGFRQWFTTDLGFYDCSNGFELRGAWNGMFLENSNLFNFAATGTLFRQGANLSFTDRCILQMNINVPTGAKFMDFFPAVFLDDEALQLVDFVAKVDDVKNDANGLLLLPNLSANNPKCLWSGNTGLPNTAIEKIITADNVSGTYTIDWLNDTYDIVMTGDTTFSQINLPASGRRTKTLNITINGNFVPTFPAGWETFKVGTYKGTDQNSIDIKFIAAGKYAMSISNSLTAYPAPTLTDISPFNFPPNDTQILTLKGSFYTPESIVKIEGQVVNSIIYKEETRYLEASVTSGNNEGDFNVFISNGTERIFENKFTVSLGTVFIPAQSDYTNILNDPDLTKTGEITIKQADIIYQADYKTIPNSQNFSIKFRVVLSSLKPTGSADFLGNTGSGIFFKNSSNSVVYRVLPRQYQTQTNDGVISLQDIPNTSTVTTSPLVRDQDIEVRRVNGTWSLRVNGIFKGNHPFINNDELLINFYVKNQDFRNIKYIELP